MEADFRDFNVAPSQGSHFFQNLTSFRIGYFTVNSFSDKDFIDWEWLLSLKAQEQKGITSHIRLSSPLTVKINGRQNKGVILKPQT